MSDSKFVYAVEFTERGVCHLLAFLTDEARQQYLYNNGYWGSRVRGCPEPCDRADFAGSGTYASVVAADGDSEFGVYATHMVDPATEAIVHESDARLEMRERGLLPDDCQI